MKKFTMFIALLLVLQVNRISAGNDIFAAPFNNATLTTLITSLAPVTPKEATFEDAVTADFSNLAPETPAEATFNDALQTDTLSIRSLAPVNPSEANFE